MDLGAHGRGPSRRCCDSNTGEGAREGGADPYFYQRDYRTLRGLLQFALATAPAVRTVADLLQLLEDDQRLDELVRLRPDAPGAADLAAALRFAPSEYPKVVAVS